MTGVLTLGPLAFPVDRVLAAAAIGLFLLLMELIGRLSRQPTTRPAWIAIIVGLVVGRLAFVWLHWSAFVGDWLAIPALWQGGFDIQLGAFAAGVSLLLTMQSRRAGVFGFAAVLLCFVGFTLANLLTQPPARPLPAIEALRSLDGKAVSLDRYRGRPFVINLWATWCPPCRRELPMLAEVARSSPVPILLVDEGEEADKVRAHLAREGIAGDFVLLDRRGAVARAVETSMFPTTIFVDSRGQIVATHYGEISRAAVLDRLAQLEPDGK